MRRFKTEKIIVSDQLVNVKKLKRLVLEHESKSEPLWFEINSKIQAAVLIACLDKIGMHTCKLYPHNVYHENHYIVFRKQHVYFMTHEHKRTKPKLTAAIKISQFIRKI